MSNQPLAKRALELFDSVLDLPEDEWSRFLDKACVDEPSLRSEVEKLLSAHGRAEGLLEDAAGPADWMQTQPSKPDEPVHGDKVGPYRLIKQIGRGGMGVVYLAQDTRLGRRVALKFLSGALTADERGRARLEAEARAASRLDHPNICTVYDLGETADGQLYLAMPYYRGRTVAEILLDGPIPVERAVDLVRQAAAGLERAHEAGVIHRDVKPGNLLVTTEGEVKILDFGVAKLAGLSLSEPGMRVGTLSYMAPEQALGEEVWPSTDLWSLGVTLYELISGLRPFRGDYEPAVIYEILHGEPVPLRRARPETPESLDRIVRKLLGKAPETRYENARELLDDLAVWDQGGSAVLREDVPHNLPETLTTFLGRTEELRKIERLLEKRRLLTLTGFAGVGKTRLAVEAARRMLGRFPDGVWFTALASVNAPSSVLGAVAASLDLDVASGSDVMLAICDRLRDATALLVLDNFEHLVEAAPEVARLLGECPDVRVLAVSRAPLSISGEQELVVPPLEGPARDADLAEACGNPAVALFLERARAARPSFALTDTNIGATVELCARLDGHPLAIELAAARVNLFSPAALLPRLNQRLDLLVNGARDAPERHRTLRRAIGWSYDLLEPGTRRVLRQLAVFSPGGSLSAAASVSLLDEVDAADALQELAAHHLVVVSETAAGEPAFVMSETIRAYGLDALEAEGELGEARRRHAEWHLQFAQHAASKLASPEELAWMDRLNAQHGNFVLAMEWAIESSVAAVALGLTASLWRVWVARGHIREGWARVEEALALARQGVEPAVAAQALQGFAVLAQNLGKSVIAKESLEECLTIRRSIDDEHGLADALSNRAWVSCELGELDDAERLTQEALAIHEQVSDKRGQALAWNNLGWIASTRAEYHSARAAFEKSLTLYRSCGDRRGEGFALACLAWSEQWHGDLKRAHRLLDEASRILLPTADPLLLGWTLTVRAVTLLSEGRLEESAEIVEKARREWKRAGRLSGKAWVLTVRGTVELLRGHLREAEEMLQRAADSWREAGSAWGIAMASGELSRALTRRGKVEAAKRALRESLDLRRSIGDRRGLAHAIETAAELAGDAEQAAVLVGSAAELRAAIGAPASAADRIRLADEVPAAAEGRSVSLPDALELAVAIATRL